MAKGPWHPGPDVATTRAVVERGERVDFVRHWANGAWEAHGENDEDIDDGDVVLVPMQRLVDRDPSIAEVARLPAGWCASRFDDDRWSLEPPKGFRCASAPEQGLLVDVGRRSKFAHHFCGAHDIAGAHCPNCDKPLLRLLSLDCRDERLGFAPLGVPFVHLLFCWTCNLAQGRTAYRLLADGGVQLLSYGRGGVESDFPYAGYPHSFPGAACDLIPVPASEQRIVDALNKGRLRTTSLRKGTGHLSIPRHQVGGRPCLLQGPPAELCPECAQPMALVACIGDATLDGRGFTGNAFVEVLFLLCARDAIVSTTQQCD